MNKLINSVLPETTMEPLTGWLGAGSEAASFEHYRPSGTSSDTGVPMSSGSGLNEPLYDRDLDRDIAAEWYEVDKEAWQQLNTGSGKGPLRSASG